ncbi:hypothetical protein D299_gp148 [Escherichia phage HX01]|nr:hypothetical protein D299_gp148 [Escherichia phage HX01]
MYFSIGIIIFYSCLKDKMIIY